MGLFSFLSRKKEAKEIEAVEDEKVANVVKVKAVLDEVMPLDNSLMAKYADYENMDDDAIISAGLDIYADDSTQFAPDTGRVVWVTSDDNELQKKIDDFIHVDLELDFKLWEIARTMCKYGSDFEEIVIKKIDDKPKITDLRDLDPPNVKVVFNENHDPVAYVYHPKSEFNVSEKLFKNKKFLEVGKMITKKGQVLYLPERLVHFKIGRGDYGTSILQKLRRTWKRLAKMEDSVFINRLTKAVDRLVYYVDTGNLPPRQALRFLNEFAKTVKSKKSLVNGQEIEQYNPLSTDEDIFIPVRNGSEAARVDTLSGSQSIQIDDLEYFRLAIFAGLKIPKSYLAWEETVARAVLSQEDIRFARSILRIQNALKHGVKKIIQVFLDLNGYEDIDTLEFNVEMFTPSVIYDQIWVEAMSVKADLASSMQEIVGIDWVLRHIFKMSDKEIEKIKKAKGTQEESVWYGKPADEKKMTKLIKEIEEKIEVENQVLKNNINKVLENLIKMRQYLRD